MKIEDQEKLWNKIAPEWNKYKQKPSQSVLNFLKKSSENILDLGSGSGRHLMEIKNGKYFLQDFSSEMLKFAKQKAEKLNIPYEIIHSKLNKIPKQDNFFDYAICISALHCVETSKKRKKTVEELYRVLKKNGKAYIGVWNINSKRFKENEKKEKMIKWTDKGKRYYYLYNEKEVHNLFESIGFKIISIHNSEMMINFIVKK